MDALSLSCVGRLSDHKEEIRATLTALRKILHTVTHWNGVIPASRAEPLHHGAVQHWVYPANMIFASQLGSQLVGDRYYVIIIIIHHYLCVHTYMPVFIITVHHYTYIGTMTHACPIPKKTVRTGKMTLHVYRYV